MPSDISAEIRRTDGGARPVDHGNAALGYDGAFARMITMRYWLIFVHGMTVLLFAGTLAWAGEAGTVIKADELKAEP